MGSADTTTPLMSSAVVKGEGREEVDNCLEDDCRDKACCLEDDCRDKAGGRTPPAWLWKWAAGDLLLEIFEEQKSPARKRAIALVVMDKVLLGGMFSMIYFTGMAFVLVVFVGNLVKG
jgi:hypothetical protein